MENVSKALIMAGEVLLGILIISLIVYFVQSYQSASDTYGETQDALQIEKFNTEVMKYLTYSSASASKNTVTYNASAQDIISLHNYIENSGYSTNTQTKINGYPLVSIDENKFLNTYPIKFSSDGKKIYPFTATVEYLNDGRISTINFVSNTSREYRNAI